MPGSFDWHARYQQQARWTKPLRDFIFPLIKLHTSRRILEVGCGTGAVLQELQQAAPASLHGLDLNRDHLVQARQNASRCCPVQGDALLLPYREQAFDVTLCHFVLLWVKNPVQMIKEMKRVTHLGGYLLALAEPDYGGRIDYPAALTQLGQWQSAALEKQGAEPNLGRRLAEIFHQAGFTSIQAGLLGGEWSLPQPPESWRGEWATLEADLATIRDLWDPAELDRLKKQDLAARQAGTRILFVPTFYAYAQVI